MNCPNCNSTKVILEGTGLIDIYEVWICQECGYNFPIEAPDHTELERRYDDIHRADIEYEGYEDIEDYENYENYESD